MGAAPEPDRKDNAPVDAEDGGAGAPSAGTEIKTDKIDTSNVLSGPRGTIINATNYYGNPAPDTDKEKRESLLEITTEFQSDDRLKIPIDAEEVARYARVLKNEVILVVGCVNRLIAGAAVQSIVDALQLEPGRARLLSFDRPGTSQPSMTIHGLLQCEGDAETGAVIVADAMSAQGQPFLDSVLRAPGAFSASSVRRMLRQRNLRLVCLADPSRYAPLTQAGEDAAFTHWTVPFLEPFLQQEFPDDHDALRFAILRQREEGRWSPDDAEMSQQVRTLTAQRRLREVVEEGGIRPQAVAVDEQGPVHQTVLFTGTFFTGLSPADFDRVVTPLLGDGTVPAPAPAGDGAAAQREKSLTQLWREAPDRIMRECGLMVLPATAGRTVEFREPGTRDLLRERLEQEYPFRLHATFRTLHDTGLLFTGSDAVAANVVRSTAQMAESYPETYGRDWMAGMLVVSRIRTEDTIPARHVVRRFGELLRELSARPAVRELVEGVLEWLLGVREFDTVFALVRQLRFAPEFDALRWLRQLIDRGDTDARTAAYAFLHRDLASVGVPVYPTLHTLAEWLPPEAADPARYSPSQRLALRLLVEYAANTAARFDADRYG